MENTNTKNTAKEQEPKQTANAEEKTEAQKPETAGGAKYTIDYALEMIEKIMEQMKDRSYEIGSLESIEDGNSRIVAAEAIKSKEETNRKLIDFYQGIIKDLKPRHVDNSEKERFYQFVQECVGAAGPGCLIPDFEKLAKEFF